MDLTLLSREEGIGEEDSWQPTCRGVREAEEHLEVTQVTREEMCEDAEEHIPDELVSLGGVSRMTMEVGEPGEKMKDQ